MGEEAPICVTCTYNSVVYPPGSIKDCRRQPTGLLTDACYNEVCMPPVTMTVPVHGQKLALNAMDVDIFSIQQPPRRRRQPPRPQRQPPQPQRQLQPQPQLHPQLPPQPRRKPRGGGSSMGISREYNIY